jgi:hypothetical protein
LKEVTMCRSKQMLGHDEAAAWPRRRSPDSVRRTALFEGGDGAEAMAVSRVLDRLDVDTMWCPGPGASHGSRCSLVETGHCDLVEKADFVLNDLGTADARDAAVASAVDDAVHGDKHVAVLAGWQHAESLRRRLPASTVVEGPLTTKIVQDVARIR